MRVGGERGWEEYLPFKNVGAEQAVSAGVCGTQNGCGVNTGKGKNNKM